MSRLKGAGVGHMIHDDDIQGTGAIVLAGLTTALEILNAPITGQRVLFLGAGSAAIGIAGLIISAMQSCPRPSSVTSRPRAAFRKSRRYRWARRRFRTNVPGHRTRTRRTRISRRE